MWRDTQGSKASHAAPIPTNVPLDVRSIAVTRPAQITMLLPAPPPIFICPSIGPHLTVMQSSGPEHAAPCNCIRMPLPLLVLFLSAYMPLECSPCSGHGPSM
jgi:hypothetical protein